MNDNEILNSFRELLKDLASEGEDWLDQGKYQQAEGLMHATARIAGLIGIHEAELKKKKGD